LDGTGVVETTSVDDAVEVAVAEDEETSWTTFSLSSVVSMALFASGLTEKIRRQI
jgi:hypothetical protein